MGFFFRLQPLPFAKIPTEKVFKSHVNQKGNKLLSCLYDAKENGLGKKGRNKSISASVPEMRKGI